MIFKLNFFVLIAIIMFDFEKAEQFITLSRKMFNQEIRFIEKARLGNSFKDFQNESTLKDTVNVSNKNTAEYFKLK